MPWEKFMNSYGTIKKLLSLLKWRVWVGIFYLCRHLQEAQKVMFADISFFMEKNSNLF